MDNEVIARNLRRLRAASGLSQTELAKAARVNSFAISHWESGRRIPTPQNIMRLAKGLGCTLNDLMGG